MSFTLTLMCVPTAWFCWSHHFWRYLTALPSATVTTRATLLPQAAVDAFVAKPSFFVGGVLVGLALFVEDTHRRGELAMYVLPKALESAWVMLRGKGIVFQTGRYGEAMVRAFLWVLRVMEADRCCCGVCS